MLACGYEGIGAMAEIEDISTYIKNYSYKPLSGQNITIGFGATKVYLDPIRYITNDSSGKMGHSLAKECFELGANVTCITSNVKISEIHGINYIEASTPSEVLKVAKDTFNDSDVFIMATAISDYIPLNYSDKKIKKSGSKLQVELEKGVDVLFELGKIKNRQTLVGFAAEDNNHIENGKNKLLNKNLDYIVINDLSAFGKEENSITLMNSKLEQKKYPLSSKDEIAKIIISEITK